MDFFKPSQLALRAYFVTVTLLALAFTLTELFASSFRMPYYRNCLDWSLMMRIQRAMNRYGGFRLGMQVISFSTIQINLFLCWITPTLHRSWHNREARQSTECPFKKTMRAIGANYPEIWYGLFMMALWSVVIAFAFTNRSWAAGKIAISVLSVHAAMTVYMIITSVIKAMNKPQGSSSASTHSGRYTAIKPMLIPNYRDDVEDVERGEPKPAEPEQAQEQAQTMGTIDVDAEDAPLLRASEDTVIEPNDPDSAEILKLRMARMMQNY